MNFQGHICLKRELRVTQEDRLYGGVVGYGTSLVDRHKSGSQHRQMHREIRLSARSALEHSGRTACGFGGRI